MSELDTMETGTSKTSWKVTAARFGAWGLGFGLGVGIVLAASLWFIERPKGWNSRDLVPHNVKAEDVGHAKIDGPNFEVDGIGTSFTFDLQNTTSEDITLPKDVRVMQSERNSGSLEDSSLVFVKDYFLPAKHTVAVSLQNPNECIKSMKTDECFNAIFKNIGQIVIFDQSAKLEIRFSVPGFTVRKDGAPSFISTD
jgi:hypothetical protein